jgi:hypothetical protein
MSARLGKFSGAYCACVAEREVSAEIRFVLLMAAVSFTPGRVR